MIDKIKKNLFLLLSTFFVFYFFFNLLDGERGLISYLNKKTLLNELKIQKIDLNKKIEDLELKNSLLSENLDLDFIEILIREKFLFGRKSESIHILKENEN
tara:strand:+ start:2380 stop:2682 length:303 start_codon:yes stop_codon:yes gene_type:complete